MNITLTLLENTVCDSTLQNGKTVTRPEFRNLTFTDAGNYVCEVSVTGLTQRQSFQLIVEGEEMFEEGGLNTY